MGLTGAQIEEIRALLERERARLVRRLRRFAEELGEVERGSFSQHMAEQAAALTERESAFLMASEEGRRLAEVDRALDRILHQGDRFGFCRGCETAIGFERLEAIPAAELCIDCKRGEEGSLDGRSN
ncbi:MAG TPA: TraR/DksA C4-type zinc finger protein [Longimicrobiales bacterium]|nr:TraR/DksA C4-type zinc finger protein [Longimicrobiales bacterium]